MADQENMNTNETGRGKRLAMIIGGIAILAAAGYGLILLAQGSSYNLKVTDPVQGPDNAPVVIEEFADFQCPACKAASSSIEQVIKAYPTQVKLVYRDFPIPGHQNERVAAAAALCAAQQGKFAVFYQKLFADQDNWANMDAGAFETYLSALAGSDEAKLNVEDFNACRVSRDAKREIERDAREGASRGVNATPTFFVDGEKKEGPQSFFQWTQLINAELAKKGLQPENTVQPATANTPQK